MPTSLRLCALLGASALALATLSPAMAQSGCAAGNSIVSVASGNPDFSTLVAAVKAAGLADRLSGGDPVTVFAPTNEAFAKLPKGTVEELLKPENKDRLARILAFHVVPGKVLAADAVKLTSAPSLSGQRLDLMLKGSDLFINGAQVIKTDIAASNGVIHVIDRVILPTEDDLAATAIKAGSFKTLVAAAQAAGLVDALKGEQPLTVLAPTDEAFAKLPAGTVESLLKPANKEALAAVLKLHIISGRVFSDQALKAGSASTLSGEAVKFAIDGGKAKVNGANIVKTDIQATNGVIHVIDAVLLPVKMPKLSSGAKAMPSRQAAAHAAAVEIASLAIDRGVPMFNDGDHAACAAIYEVACRAILSMDRLPSSLKSRLEIAMSDAARASSAADKAWALRHGLDAATGITAVSAR